MRTLKDAIDETRRIRKELQPGIENAIVANGDTVVSLIKEQLASGLDGDGRNITPNYLTDPFFQSAEAGHWKGNAKGYAHWKQKTIQPRIHIIGYPPRNKDSPNLFIRGDYFDSLMAIPVSGGVEVVSSGVTFGNDILSKYGKIILQLAPQGKEYFIRKYIYPELTKIINKSV